MSALLKAYTAKPVEILPATDTQNFCSGTDKTELFAQRNNSAVLTNIENGMILDCSKVLGKSPDCTPNKFVW